MRKLFRWVQGISGHNTPSDSLSQFVGTKLVLSGVIFVLLNDQGDKLNDALRIVLSRAVERDFRFFGMVSGLLQFVVEGKQPEGIAARIEEFSKGIVSDCTSEPIVVWTIRECAIGCWGNEKNITYGAMVPCFKDVLNAMASAQPRSVLKI